MTDCAARILLAEDNRMMADVMRFNLERSGYATCVATGGQVALDLFRQQPFDLVITDYQMPGLNGEQLCRSIRQGDYRPDVRLFLCSAKAFELDVAQLRRELQLQQVFYKPFSPRAIVAAVQELFPQPAPVG